MSEHIIIIGAGHAGGQAAVSLRSGGFTGSIQIIGEESHLPYQRPPLSKKYLSGEMPIEKAYLKPAEFYAEENIELILNTRTTAIDREAKQVSLADGRRLPYDRLLLTTGSRVRRLQIPGAELNGVHYLRNVQDVLAIQQNLGANDPLVVVGAGYIGLEVAAVYAKRGHPVVVLEREGRVMARVVGEDISTFYRAAHEQAGVTFHFHTNVSKFQGDDGRISGVVADNGQVFPARAVVVGVGILPETELAEQAGLSCDDGIMVDEFGRTEDPAIFAAGDCTNHPNSLLKRRLRLESVQNAMDQARTAAAAMLGDTSKPYAAIPRFWSDQYDLKLQIVGLSQGYDSTVLRGDPAVRKFAVFYLQDGRVIAVDAVNAPQDFMLARKFIENATPVEPTRLADTGVPLKEML